jgi:alkylated DNA repair dioxygenase AlkB
MDRSIGEWPTQPERIDRELGDGRVTLWPAAFDTTTADELHRELERTIDWQHETFQLFGTPRKVPRLVAWHGDPGTIYTYSGVTHVPNPWTPALERVRARASELSGAAFNSVLLNRYRSGRDAMGWHSDDEPELGPEPLIASVSLGATRRFRLRHRKRRDRTLSFDLPHGSLLLMSGALQTHWMHSLARTSQPVAERLNLTLRRVIPTSDRAG